MRKRILSGMLVMMFSAAFADSSALVSLVAVRQGMLAPVVTAYGLMAADPNSQVAVVAGREARIGQVFVHLGQVVKKGQPLVTLLNSPNSQTQYDQAKSALSFARKDLEQNKRLFSEQLATKSQLAAAKRAYQDALAASNAQNAMGAARTGPLLAPVEGVVTTLSGARGDTIAAGATVATIADHAGLVVNMGLEPRDAARAHNGNAVSIEDPVNHSSVAAKLISVGSMIDPQSRVVSAVARADATFTPNLIVGMTVKARISLDAQKGIIVPRSALMSDADGTFVWVVKNNVARRRPVTVSVEADQAVLITSGLAVRDLIVSAGVAGVSNGGKVRTH
jgi:RND family efflux transporter MFP subunit